MHQQMNFIISNSNLFNNANKFRTFETEKYTPPKKWTEQIKAAFSVFSKTIPSFIHTIQDIDN